MKYMKYLLLFIASIIAFEMSAQTKGSQPVSGKQSLSSGTYKNAALSYIIIPSKNKTWGYDIYMEKRMFIHQLNAPGLPGNDGFKTKIAAGKVASLVIEKIKKGEMPPTVTIEEMKKLKVL
jgi:hypothetical protein